MSDEILREMVAARIAKEAALEALVIADVQASPVATAHLSAMSIRLDTAWGDAFDYLATPIEDTFKVGQGYSNGDSQVSIEKLTPAMVRYAVRVEGTLHAVVTVRRSYLMGLIKRKRYLLD